MVGQPPDPRKGFGQGIVQPTRISPRHLQLPNDAVNEPKGRLLNIGDAVGQPPESQGNLGYGTDARRGDDVPAETAA